MGKQSFILEGLGTFLLVIFGGFQILHGNGDATFIPAFYAAFYILGSKSESGHLNPAITLFYMITKKINNKEGSIRLLIQLVASVLAGLLLMLLDPEDLNGGTATKPDLLLSPKFADIDAKIHYTILIRIINTIFTPILLGVFASFISKTNMSVVRTGLAWFLCYAASNTLSYNTTNSGALNLMRSLGPGIFLQYQKNFFASPEMWLIIIGSFVGVLGGGCLGHYFLFEDGIGGEKAPAAGEAPNAKSIEV